MQEDLVDYSRKWYILAAVGMGVLLSTIDGSIVNVSLPTLSRTFDAEFALVQWVVLAYLVTLTTLILSVGRLGDLIGKKRPYTAGFVIFTLGSVLCGMAPSIYWLIGSRVIQGFGAAMMVALGTAIITEAFPGSERGKALGISGSIVSTGIVIGPVLGGLLIETFSWRWIFFVNLPVGILGILMVLRFVPASRPKWSGRFDFLGAITLFISLISLLFALTVGQEQGFTERLVLVLFLISIVFLVLFLLIEQKIEHPMVDLTMFENRKFSVGLISGFLTFVAIAGTIILMPFYLENVLGYGTRTVGFFLAIVPISMGFTAPIAGSLSDRMGTRPITILGLAVLIVGYLSLTTLETSTSPVGYIVRFLPIGIGMGIFQSPNNSAIMGSVLPKRLGIASGLLAITRTLGQTTGIAVLGALWVSRVTILIGEDLQGGATNAPADIQVGALSDTFIVVAGMIVLALAIVILGEFRERISNKPPGLEVLPQEEK